MSQIGQFFLRRYVWAYEGDCNESVTLNLSSKLALPIVERWKRA